MIKEKGKKHDGKSRPSNEAYKDGWNKIYLNRILKTEVEIGANGTQRYVLKAGKNKGKIL
jgi:hypothetical protein